MDNYINNIVRERDLLGVGDVQYRVRTLIEKIYAKVRNVCDNEQLSFRDVFVDRNEVIIGSEDRMISLEQFRDIIGTWYGAIASRDSRVKTYINIHEILRNIGENIDINKYCYEDVKAVALIGEESDFWKRDVDICDEQITCKLKKIEMEEKLLDILRGVFDEDTRCGV